MADDKGRSASGLIALVLLAATAIVVRQLPYTTARPDQSDKTVISADAPQDVVSRLWQDPFAAVDQHRREVVRDERGGLVPPEPPERHGALSVATTIRNDHRPLIIMPVFTFGGPYADDAENRRRVRYAVLSSFGASNYVADDNGRIGYMNVPGGPVQIVPYEWLSHRLGTHPRVLLLWIDEDGRWIRPLQDLAGLLRRLGLCRDALVGDGRRSVRLKVVGPQTAGSVLDIAGEINDPLTPGGEPCYGRAEMYTLSTAAELPSVAELGGRRPNALAARGLRPLRTIRRDADLLPVVTEELERRGVDLARDRVMLLGEWDSEYSRRLVDVFRRLCPGRHGCPDVYTYLRGLDGLVPGPKDGAAAPSEGARRAPPGAEPGRPERATGNAQLDYLRRLAGYIREAERAVDRHQRVKAIGVLGSDVYDKLLVLQALRETYPDALFFTTDLDARFQQPSEFKWVRNLIVVSSFGLQLSEMWQGAIPPFRDSYQTAQFLAVRLALADWPEDFFQDKRLLSDWPRRSELTQADLDRAMTIRTFEIGRTSAIDLSPWDSDLHPRPGLGVYLGTDLLDAPRLVAAAIALALGVVLIVMASLRVRAALRVVPGAFQRHPVAGWTLMLGGLLAMLAVGVAIHSAVLIEDYGIEPFAWFEGVSMWPSEIVRALAIVVAIVFLVKVAATTRRTTAALEGEFFERLARAPDAVAAPPRRAGWIYSLFGIAMRSGHDTSDIDTETLWRRYRHLMALPQRGWRIALLSVSFLALAMVMVFGVFGKPHVPHRGTLAWAVDTGLLVVAIAAGTVLMFAVTDAIWICLRFTRELGRPVPTGWPEELLAREAKRLSLAPEPLKAWLDVQFVTRWTAGLVSIVYYPAVVICLLILARSTVFDRWDPAPVGLGLIVVMSLGFTVGCAVSLRRMAERVRTNTRATLMRALLQGQDASPGQLARLITEVENASGGAFTSLGNQAFVRAALLPLSSAGGLAFVEWFVLGH
jgi:hypothetical protein